MTRLNKYGEIQDTESYKVDNYDMDTPWWLPIFMLILFSMAWGAKEILGLINRRSIDNMKQQVSVVYDGDYAIADGTFLEAYRDEIPLVRVDLIIDRNNVDENYSGCYAVTACPKATSIHVQRPDADRGWKSEYPVGSKWRTWGTIRRSDSYFSLTLHRAERL